MIDRYAVIGNPIAQSKSPLVHGLFAAATGEALTYEALLAPVDGFAAVVRQFVAGGGRGLNITTPFKDEAFALATHHSPRALRARAVNALRFSGDAIEAENFDGLGLLRDIIANLQQPVENTDILILGAGGAARGALQPLLEARPARLTIANRTSAKAEALAADFADLGAVAGLGLAELARGYDIIINATSAALSGDSLDIPSVIFQGCKLAYEMAYGKGETAFLAAARTGGAEQVTDGAGMLVEQAAEAFNWWRGIRPDTAEALAAVRASVAT